MEFQPNESGNGQPLSMAELHAEVKMVFKLDTSTNGFNATMLTNWLYGDRYQITEGPNGVLSTLLMGNRTASDVALGLLARGSSAVRT